MARCAADHVASLEAKSRAPRTTVRQAWLPGMVASDPRPKRHPEAGGCRLWRLRGQRDLSGRMVELSMALNRHVSQDLPGTGRTRQTPTEPQRHPCKATAAHASWLLDGGLMDGALDGHRWWSLIILDGSARTRRAGAVAPSAARGVALTVLSPAWRRYGGPEPVLSASGGAFLSGAFAGVWTRLDRDHHTLGSPEDQSSMHLLETPCNIQRRVDDSQVALTRPPLACAEAHPRLLELSTTTAHQGRLTAPCASPIPLHVLGEGKGRLSPPQALERTFARALLPRTTKCSGCVTWHSYHYYVAQGFPQQQVVLWGYGQALRAVVDQGLFAASHCHDALREGKGKDRRVDRFYPRPFAARQEQGALIERNPRESMGVYRPQSWMRRASLPLRAAPLWLFARIQIA